MNEKTQPKSFTTPKSVQELRRREADDMAGMPALPETGAGGEPLTEIAHDPTFGLLNPSLFEHLWRVATALARSSIVPKHFQGKTEDCFIATQMALQLKCQPLMVLQNTYIVYGNPGFSAKFAIALANQRGPFDGVIQYKSVGAEGTDDYGVIAYARIRKTGQIVEAKVDMKMARAENWAKNNPKYASMPEHMLTYRAATFLIRRYCPEVLFGMPTAEELEDTRGFAEHYVNAEVVGYGEDDEPQTTPKPDQSTTEEQPQKNDESSTQEKPPQKAASDAAKSPESSAISKPARTTAKTAAPEPPKGAQPATGNDTGSAGPSFDEICLAVRNADAADTDARDMCYDLANSLPANEREIVRDQIRQKWPQQAPTEQRSLE